MTISALAPWYGSNRMLAPNVGAALKGCRWVGIPFAGGLSEVAEIKAPTIVCNDLHKHLINLALIAADPIYGPKLYRRLRRMPFHPWILEAAQRACATYDPPNPLGGDMEARLNFAVDYFVCCWMGRSAKAGADGEFKGGLPVRWNANGGDSAVRFSSAVQSLRPWRRILERCNFVCEDAFDFLEKCKDESGHAIYSDAPWPEDGDKYVHRFTESDQRRLANKLVTFNQCRVVVRFGDHPLIRELYPEDKWQWHRHDSRTAANKAKSEALITRN